MEHCTKWQTMPEAEGAEMDELDGQTRRRKCQKDKELRIYDETKSRIRRLER
jgi:hypothetical protein